MRLKPLIIALDHCRVRSPRGLGAFSFFMILLSCACWPSSVAAQKSNDRLLTRDDGLAIIKAISDRQFSLHRHTPKPDCSHLVNQVYALAGFPYPYVKSLDLYVGDPNFVRVAAPQPGDLIVWRGHVGLVIDPHQHSFYSSLRSGMETEDYTSPYWRRHGSPRFYRYRIRNDAPYLTARRNLPRDENGDDFRSGNFKTLQVSESTADNDRDEGDSQSGDEPAPAIPSHQSFTSASSETSSRSAGNSAIQPNRRSIDAGADVSSEIVIPASHDKPTVEQVHQAILKWQQSQLNGLSAETLLRSRSTIVIFDQLRVEKLQLKGKHGVAYVTVDSGARLSGGLLDKSILHDEQHWEMQHAKSGWTLVQPTQNIYVPRTLAVRIFAQQLARLSDTNDSEVAASTVSQQSHLASLLNTLLDK
jgi:hypothetical protein